MFSSSRLSLRFARLSKSSPPHTHARDYASSSDNTASVRSSRPATYRAAFSVGRESCENVKRGHGQNLLASEHFGPQRVLLSRRTWWLPKCLTPHHPISNFSRLGRKPLLLSLTRGLSAGLMDHLPGNSLRAWTAPLNRPKVIGHLPIWDHQRRFLTSPITAFAIPSLAGSAMAVGR